MQRRHASGPGAAPGCSVERRRSVLPNRTTMRNPPLTVPLKQTALLVLEGHSATNRRTPPALDTWPSRRMMGWDRSYADLVAECLCCYFPELRLRFHNVAIGGQGRRDLADRLEAVVVP